MVAKALQMAGIVALGLLGLLLLALTMLPQANASGDGTFATDWAKPVQPAAATGTPVPVAHP